MRKTMLIATLALIAFGSQACVRNYLTIRELPSDVARAGRAHSKKMIQKEIRIEKTGEGDAASKEAVLEAKAICEPTRTQSSWLIFNYNGIETLYWCTPSHEMTQKPACIPVRYGGAAIFPEPGLKTLPLRKAPAPIPESR